MRNKACSIRSRSALKIYGRMGKPTRFADFWISRRFVSYWLKEMRIFCSHAIDA